VARQRVRERLTQAPAQAGAHPAKATTRVAVLPPRPLGCAAFRDRASCFFEVV
jgi:hypothetical protein